MQESPLRTRLCEEYGCELPIVAFAHTKDVVAAVTNAGGIGVLGGGRISAEELRSAIRWIRERVGDRPFGVDLLVPASFVEGNREELEAMIPEEHRAFVAQLRAEHGIPEASGPYTRSGVTPELLENTRRSLDIVFEEQVPIFAAGLGNPAFLLERAHAAGIKVWGLVGLPRQAQRQIEAGVDVIIAQGYDAGGHSGTVGTFTLVPEVVRLAEGTSSLVLAAGGVSNGSQLAAVITMGAAGVWTGTIWLATHESETEMFLKQRLIDTRAEDTVQSRATSGKPIRQLPSKWSEAWKQPDAPEPLPSPLQPLLVHPLLAGIYESQMEEWMTTPAGQSVVGIHEIRPAAEVVYQLADEAIACFERIGGGLDQG